MIINIDQDDYVKEVGDTAGLRVVVHPQDRMPFPEDEGITVATGYATSVGLRQVLVSVTSLSYYAHYSMLSCGTITYGYISTTRP